MEIHTTSLQRSCCLGLLRIQEKPCLQQKYLYHNGLPLGVSRQLHSTVTWIGDLLIYLSSDTLLCLWCRRMRKRNSQTVVNRRYSKHICCFCNSRKERNKRSTANKQSLTGEGQEEERQKMYFFYTRLRLEQFLSPGPPH